MRNEMTSDPAVTALDDRGWRMPLDGPRRAAVDRFERPARWPSLLLDTVRSRQQLGVPEHIDALAEIVLPDQDGLPVRLRDLWRHGPAVIVWLRQFGCPFCRAYSVQLNRDRSHFDAADARLVLIGQGTPADATSFRRQFHLDLQILTDADRVTYLWAGTKLATFDELVGPTVVMRGIVAMAREHVAIGRNTADEAQLGGSIVVGHDGAIAFAHISQDASDMAPPAVLLAVLGDLARERATGQRATGHRMTARRPAAHPTGGS
jgi:peroxiredoxin